jgi:hypothetical protein
MVPDRAPTIRLSEVNNLSEDNNKVRSIFFEREETIHGAARPVSGVHLLLHQDERSAARGSRHAKILSRHTAFGAPDGCDAGGERLHRANSRAGPVDPSADPTCRIARLRVSSRHVASTRAPRHPEGFPAPPERFGPSPGPPPSWTGSDSSGPGSVLDARMPRPSPPWR